MSTKLTKDYKVAFDAVERIAHAQGHSEFDRAQILAQLRNRISDQIVDLSTKAEAKRGTNPVSQREGD